MFLHHTPHPDDPIQPNEPIEDDRDYNPHIDEIIQSRLDDYYGSEYPDMETFLRDDLIINSQKGNALFLP